MYHNYVDIHCHPSLKPYSKSFKYNPPKQNPRNAGRKNSIWHYSPPTFLEKLVNRVVTLTKFTQTDLTALAKSNTQVVIVALYPFEKHFFGKEILGIKGITDVLVNLAAGISQARMDYIRSLNDYFQDLTDEYQYYQQLHNQVEEVDGKIFTYRLVKNYEEIAKNFRAETETRKIINIVLSIEGAHSFNTGLKLDKDMASRSEVLANVRTVKNWEHRPLFVTLAHHFYNELAGHARSISIGAIKKNQNRGLNTGITHLGREVIHSLLDNREGKRILIDIKHLSPLSRIAYYQILSTEYAGEDIPIIASHAACNGRKSLAEPNVISMENHAEWFCNLEINFYDDEVIRIAQSKGVFGLQLDTRRIGSDKAIAESKVFFPNKRRQMGKKALLVWRQVQHIAEVLDRKGLFCWGIQCIGSDFDGIVNPINGLWTAENMRDLAVEMTAHAQDYLKKNAPRLRPINQLDAETVVHRVMKGNAMEFIAKNY